MCGEGQPDKDERDDGGESIRQENEWKAGGLMELKKGRTDEEKIEKGDIQSVAAAGHIKKREKTGVRALSEEAAGNIVSSEMAAVGSISKA